MATLLGALLQNESGGRNVTQGNIGDINNKTGDLAKGYFQITDGTWRDFGGLNTGYSRAIDAPYEVQAKIAANIPLKRWGPNTIAAMQGTGKPIDVNRTLGENLSMHGEDVANPQMAIDAAHPGQTSNQAATSMPAPGTPGGAQGPPNPPGWTGPNRDDLATAMTPKEKPTVLGGISDTLGGLGEGFGQQAKAMSQTAPIQQVNQPVTPGAVAPTVNTDAVAQQRNQLAQALARLNSGKLYG
jgi:hypothetical protein